MNKREKTLAMVLGLAGGVFFVGKFIAPAIHNYVFAVRDENRALRGQLEELLTKQEEVEPLRKDYTQFLARTGGTDATAIRNTLQKKLTDLVDRAGLTNPRISPHPPTDYRPPERGPTKTGIKQLRFSVTAEGQLARIVEFLRDFYEMPYIAQVTELKLDPPSTRSKDKGGAVRMSATIEAIVPPVHAAAEVNPARLQQPAKVVKYRGGDYLAIATRDPFSEYVAPPPPPVQPPPRQPDPEPPPQPVVAELPPPEPTPPPPPPPPAGDPLRDQKVVRMTMSYGVDEVLVVNTQDKSTEYVSLGGKLDGGNVLLVHPLGAAVRRDDGVTRVYPVGKRLAECLPISDAAANYPEIVYAYGKLKPIEPEAPPPAAAQLNGEAPQTAVEGNPAAEPNFGVEAPVSPEVQPWQPPTEPMGPPVPEADLIPGPVGDIPATAMPVEAATDVAQEIPPEMPVAQPKVEPSKAQDAAKLREARAKRQLERRNAASGRSPKGNKSANDSKATGKDQPAEPSAGPGGAANEGEQKKDEGAGGNEEKKPDGN